MVLDRYYDSSVAYQGFGRGLGPETIAQIHHIPPLHYMPQLTFYLDIPYQLSLSRIEQRGQAKDYFESQGVDFFRRMAQGFDWCAQHYPQRVVRVAAQEKVETIAATIAHIVKERLHGQ